MASEHLSPVPEFLQNMTEEEFAAYLVEDRLNSLRHERDRRIALTDWAVLPDSAITGSKLEEWKTYRQALRDITSNYTSLEDVVWPTKPL